MFRAICLSVALATLSFGPAGAQNCRIHKLTGKCINVPASQQVKPDFDVGDEFPVYERSMLMNIDRYGLAPVNGSWRYYKSGYHIYKVDVDTSRVLEIVKTVRK
ncbi:MAG: hypothetical protein KDE00_05290 [Rhodobacteraceae bacterium]|nr:hypothetical protein [Paracoccaceae bacterium]